MSQPATTTKTMAPVGDAVLHLDETSALVHVEAGVRLGVLAEALSPRGLTLGVLPIESRGRTLGAALSAPRPSEATPRERLVDRCAALSARLPDGRLIDTRLAPRKATGPDFSHALLGARGENGHILSAWLRLTRRPRHTLYAGFALDGASALRSVRWLLDVGVRPAELMLVDAALATNSLAQALRDGEVAVLLRLDGARESCVAEERLVLADGQASGGRVLPPPIVEEFLARRAPLPLGEVHVSIESLDDTWNRRPAPSLLTAFRPAGCALRSQQLPAPPQISALAQRLRRELTGALRNPAKPISCGQ